MIELTDLRSFVEVLESGGFSRAAQRLAVSKSMISRRVARMEASLGVRLLSRTTRGISATEAGLELKSRGERILTELADAEEAMAQQGDGVVGRLRLSLPLSFGVRHVTPLLTELVQRHPRLEIDAEYTDRITDLIADRFDAAVRIGALKDSSLVARRIAPVRVLVVASPSYLASQGTPLTPGDLEAHPCLIYTGGSSSDWVFRSGKRTIAIRPKARLRSDSGDAIAQWVRAGLGIGVLPAFLITDAIEFGDLRPLLLDYALPEVAIHVVRPPGSYVPGKVRVLIDMLVERLGGDAAWSRDLPSGNNDGPPRR